MNGVLELAKLVAGAHSFNESRQRRQFLFLSQDERHPN
jgi:hypothetical protein